MAYNKNLINASIATFFGFVLLLAIFQYVKMSASAENPISAPISGPMETPSDEPTHNDNNGGNGNSGNDNSPKECHDEKPHSSPVIKNWVKTGDNEVTLYFDKAQGPVSYYVVNYGLKPQSPLYGNPNIGDQNTTSVKIDDLSGTETYYFTVAAANGCVHSKPSNEVAVKINGSKISKPASGFNVLASSVQKSHNVVAQPTAKPQPETPADLQQIIENKKPSGFFDSVVNFFKLIFR